VPDDVLVTRAGGVATITLNRPERLNAMSLPMVEHLRDVLTGLAAGSDVRAVVLTGAGRGFCAGADLNDAFAHKDSAAFSDPENFLRLVQE